MIEDMGYTGHRLGYYAGGLAAAFCGGQFCSSVLWGMISDRFGRKITIIMGTFGAAAGMLVFGTSHCYAQAIIGRFVGGFLNGNIGVLKSFLTEITDHSNRGQGFAYISVSWALGMDRTLTLIRYGREEPWSSCVCMCVCVVVVAGRCGPNIHTPLEPYSDPVGMNPNPPTNPSTLIPLQQVL